MERRKGTTRYRIWGDILEPKSATQFNTGNKIVKMVERMPKRMKYEVCRILEPTRCHTI